MKVAEYDKKPDSMVKVEMTLKEYRTLFVILREVASAYKHGERIDPYDDEFYLDVRVEEYFCSKVPAMIEPLEYLRSEKEEREIEEDWKNSCFNPDNWNIENGQQGT